MVTGVVPVPFFFEFFVRFIPKALEVLRDLDRPLIGSYEPESERELPLQKGWSVLETVEVLEVVFEVRVRTNGVVDGDFFSALEEIGRW